MAQTKINQSTKDDSLSAEPVKDFFVEMLTRDIALEDAILDLLDNSVDGVVREIGKKGLKEARPYEGYRAEITIGHKQFSIRDNCGGIPEDRRNYAFRMGTHPDAPDPKLPTVGTYGIGMKRAMFKMGRNCEVETKNDKNQYAVTFSKSWFDRPDEWKVPVTHDNVVLKENGTRITVTSLRDDVRDRFAQQGFIDDVRERIETHYALILEKGFSVTLNGEPVKGKPLRLRFSEKENGIRPFLFRGKVEGVEIFLAVGFTMPIPNEKEANSDEGVMASGTYRAAEAGWTVVCNDRTVLYCDKTILTGWGESPVPNYHNQFIAISGVVEFRCDDASKLPTTTTKRGIDAASGLYLRVKQKMREGMKLFTDFTNQWKGERAAQGKELIKDAPTLEFRQIKERALKLNLKSVTKFDSGSQLKPNLPRPPATPSDTVRIAFSRRRTEVETLADHLFGDAKTSPALVGERCYELILQKVK